MLLVVELMLTARAWKKGWGARALLPLGLGLVLAFIMGGVLGASGASTSAIFGVGFLMDIGVVIVLGIMGSTKPQDAIDREAAENSSLSSIQSDIAQVPSHV